MNEKDVKTIINLNIDMKYQRIFCYHGTDMDAKSAAWILHKIFPEQTSPERFLNYDYFENKPYISHNSTDDVFILGLPVLQNDYDKLVNMIKTCRSVTLIDNDPSSMVCIMKHINEFRNFSNFYYNLNQTNSVAFLTYATVLNDCEFFGDWMTMVSKYYSKDQDDDSFYQQVLSVLSKGFIYASEMFHDSCIINPDGSFNSLFWDRLDEPEFLNQLVSEGLNAQSSNGNKNNIFS